MTFDVLLLYANYYIDFMILTECFFSNVDVFLTAKIDTAKIKVHNNYCNCVKH